MRSPTAGRPREPLAAARALADPNLSCPCCPIAASEPPIKPARRSWFITAAPLTTDTVARFYLRDADSGKQYEAIVPLNPQGGIVSFSLPASFQDLEISRPYHWFLVLNTGDRPPSVETPFARGTIERVAATAETARGLEISLESAASAGREGRWYDVAAILAILRQNRPEDPTLNASWEELLESVRLGWLADSPLASNAER